MRAIGFTIVGAGRGGPERRSGATSTPLTVLIARGA